MQCGWWEQPVMKRQDRRGEGIRTGKEGCSDAAAVGDEGKDGPVREKRRC